MLTLISICRGRLEYLQRALPSWDTCPILSETILVDCLCPDGCGQWTAQHYPRVTVVRDNEAQFSLARSRNVGAGSASGEWLFFCDSDIVLRSGFSECVANLLTTNAVLTIQDREKVLVPGLGGLLICRRRDFDLLGGYDELFTSWGGEDDDLLHRLLVVANRKRGAIPWPAVLHLDHPDSLRHINYSDIGSGSLQQRQINAGYLTSKFVYMLLSKNLHPSTEEKHRIMHFVKASTAPKP